MSIFDGGFPNGFNQIFGSITVDLNPGDVISVVGYLEAIGRDGGAADAFGTMTMSFSDDSNLQAIGVVPVPAAVWLLASGLLGLLGLRRSR